MLRHGVLPLAIATMALSTFLKELVKTFYSAEASPFPSIAPEGDLHVLGVAIAWQNIAVLVVAIAAVVGLQLLLRPDAVRPPDAGGGAESDGGAAFSACPSSG